MKILKHDLLKGLNKIKPALSATAVFDEVANFMFTKDRVLSFTDELCFSAGVPGIDFEGTINAVELSEFLKKTKSNEITLTVDKNELVVEAGRAKAGFAFVDTQAHPLITDLISLDGWEDVSVDFLLGIKMAVDSASSDTSQPIITNVSFTKKGTIEATDNYRIVRYETDISSYLQGLLIPATSLKEVLKLFPTHITKKGDWVHFKDKDENIISVRYFKKTFVDVNKILNPILKKDIEDSFTFTENTVSILDKAIVFSKDKLTESKVQISIKKKTMEITAESFTGWFEESIDLEKEQKVGFVFSTTPHILKDILNNTKTCFIDDNILLFKTDKWVYVIAIFES